MTSSYDADVIVVGGGIAGLGLACALANSQLHTLLIEKRSGPGGIDRGDSLLPKTTALFQRWGVLDSIRSAGAVPIQHMEIHHHRYGPVFHTPLTTAKDSSPYLVLPHAKIEETLLEYALQSGQTRLIRPGKVVDVLRENDKITGVKYQSPGGLKEARARLVIACDGYRSVVRRALQIEAKAKFYDHAYLGLEAARPTGYQDAMRIHFHKDGGVLLMPRHDRIGIGMLVEPKSSSYWLQLSQEELQTQLATRVPMLKDVTLYRDGSHVYDLARAHATHYVRDGAVILGDAAHVTNPTAGQGMTMALGDAGKLAELIIPALESGAVNLTPTLKEFEAHQWPINKALIRGSHRLAKLYSLRGRKWDWVKTQCVRALASPFAQPLVQPVIRRFLTQKKAPSAPIFPSPRRPLSSKEIHS